MNTGSISKKSSVLNRKTLISLVFLHALFFVSGCGKDPLVAGNDYFKQGNYVSAVIEYKNAVQANPNSNEARLALAEALERTFDTMGAEQHLRKILANGGDANTLLPRIALFMLDRNEAEKVINEFKDKRLPSPEADSNLRAIVAVSYLATGKFNLAAQQISATSATTPATILAKAQMLLAQEKKAEALAALDSSLSEKSSPWWVLRALGRINEAVGQREQAFQYIKRAQEAAPWHRGVLGEYGEFLVGMGKLDDAVAVRDKLKKLAPGFYWTVYLDALILARQGHSEESLAAGLKVLAAAPGHLPATLLVASAELKKGDVAMADRRLKKITSQHPHSVPLITLLAQTQLALRKPAEALDVVKRGLREAPNNQTLRVLQAEGHTMQGAFKEAMLTLEKLNAEDPENPAYLLRLVELKIRTGNKEAARKLLERATEIGRDNPTIRDRIISSALDLGDLQRIRQLAEYAIRVSPKDPQAHLTMAAALDIQKDSAGAWQETLTALDLQPAFQPALTALTMMVQSPRQRDELMARYESAIKAKPADASTYLNYARLQKEAKRDQSAINSLLESGIVAFPTSTSLREALVRELIRSGKQDSALSVAQSGASANNAAASAIGLLASVYDFRGDTQLATETYRKLANDYPQRTDWRLKLAEYEAAAGRKKEATSILRSIITDRPFDPTAYVRLANLTAPDNLNEALSIAREMGLQEAQKMAAMLLEGDLLLGTGKPDEALKQFSKAEKAGAIPAANLRAVQLLDRTNRKPSGDQELAAMLRKFPDDPTVVGFAAQRYRAQGNIDKAIELLAKIADKQPGNQIILNDLAWAQTEANRIAEAEKNALLAAKLAPDSPPILDTLGVVQSRAKKHDDAIRNLRIAVNLAPKIPAYRLHLAEAYASSGNLKEAKAITDAMPRNDLSVSDQKLLEKVTGSLTK